MGCHSVAPELKRCRCALHSQLAQVLSDVPPKCAELLASRTNDISVCISAAVFFASTYVEVSLPHTMIGDIYRSGIDLEITGYPCSDVASRK